MHSRPTGRVQQRVLGREQLAPVVEEKRRGQDGETENATCMCLLSERETFPVQSAKETHSREARELPAPEGNCIG